MLERYIEKKLGDKVKALGGAYEKFTSPSRRSVPDRIVILPDGVIIFVELKATGKQATMLQEIDHERRRALGCDVRVINSIEQIERFPNV